MIIAYPFSTTVELIDSITQFIRTKRRRVGIIGMAGAGKTTLWNYLKGERIPAEYLQTAIKEDIGTIYVTVNGKKIKIKHGEDIPGNILFAHREEMNKLIDSNRIILFLFNIYEYHNNTDGYQNSVQVRLKTVVDLLEDKEKSHFRSTHFYILGTHRDLLVKNKINHFKVESDFKELLRSKNYPNNVINNLRLIRLVDGKNYSEELRKYMVKILS